MNRRSNSLRLRRALQLAALLAPLAAGRLPAQPGLLDWTFDGDGRYRFWWDLGGTLVDRPQAAAAQPDGKIVLTGYSDTGFGDVDVVVARVLADGGLDATFAGDGRLALGLNLGGGANEDAPGVAIQPDGKIVVVGTADTGAGDTDLFVYRLHANGTNDDDFGASGLVTIDWTADPNPALARRERGRAVALQSDGKIVVAGTYDTGSEGIYTAAFVARLTPGGELDASFDGDGRQHVLIYFRDEVNAVALDREGRILLAGSTHTENVGNPEDLDCGLVRLLANGKPDADFGGNGTVLHGWDSGSYQRNSCRDLAVREDGRILIALQTTEPASQERDFALFQLLDDGERDTLWGAQGRARVDFNLGTPGPDPRSNDALVAMQLDAAGGVLLAGTVEVGDSEYHFGLARIGPDGFLDAEFGSGGLVHTGFFLSAEDDDTLADLVTVGQGRLVAVGSSKIGSGPDADATLARYFPVPEMFADGFESGDWARWSSTAP
jgi:uncharacterized delta-60 repeat protein